MTKKENKTEPQEEPVDLLLDLGALKPAIKRAAQSSKVSVNEFICNALESHIRREREYEGRENYTPHGGKHLAGKHTGYEVTEDGKYYPAPSWTHQFEQLFAERIAIHNLIQSLVEQSQTRLIEVEKQLGNAKASLVDDLGLDTAKNWAYYGGASGYLAELPAERVGDGQDAE